MFLHLADKYVFQIFSRGMSALRPNRLNRELAMVRKSEYVEEVTLVNNDIGSWLVSCVILQLKA